MSMIYLCTNKINGKMYIGQTKNSLAVRSAQHKWGKIGKTYFKNAILKYGFENFSWKEIDRDSSQEEINNLEKLYIEMFGTSFSEIGYNCTEGGDGAIIPNGETREKMSLIQKSLWNDPKERAKRIKSTKGIKKTFEHKKKLAAALQGIKHTEERRHNQSLAHLGHKLSKETKEKMSLAQKGKPKSPEHIQAARQGREKYFKKVLCVELNKVYNTIAEASSEHSLPHANIIKVCQGQRNTAGGYHWQYAEAA